VPWRANRDPYRIWISEVMLQQTQVVTVIPYFERFVRKLPTLSKLAQADEQAVLRLWEGLGYYRRARALCQAARTLHAAGYKTIPDDPDLVGSLPGFGRYTVNAVLSQAYDRRLPILEANSQRVLCRLFGIDKDPRNTKVRDQLWQLAESLLPTKSVGDFNQALMELGALVCTPAQPECAVCPLRSCCVARQQNRQQELPLRAKPAETVAVDEVAVVVHRRDRLLLVQRGDEGRWANLWEFPHHALGETESHAAAADRLLGVLGVAAELGDEISTIRHSVTRFRITMVCLHAVHRRGVVRTPIYQNSAWVRAEELHGYPLSTPQRRLARKVLELNSNQ
jgi:A/G-specific adenine glycosylase